MKKSEQKTWLATIKARIEWNEKGSVDLIADDNGPWNIVMDKPHSRFVRYFQPSYETGFDPYGQPENPNQ